MLGRRQHRGLSQEDLGELAGCHRTYISEVETGDRNVMPLNIGRIVAALGVSVGEFMSVAESRLASGESAAT